MKPFNREKFLLFMLAGIFIWQAAIFTYGAIGCFKHGGKGACPELGDRYENTVNVMVATTLALLGAGAVAGVTKRNSSTSDPALPSSQERVESKPQSLLQERVQASARGLAQESGSEKEPEKKGRPYTKRE